MKRSWRAQVLAIAVALFAGTAIAGDTIYPMAILPFSERGREVTDQGQQVTDLMFANLVINPELYLVDREDMTKLLAEQELNVSGLVNPDEAVKIGKLTGAKVIVTGSVMQIGDTQYIIAKVIGTETSRVLGASVKGSVRDELDTLVEDLAEKVSETIADRADELVAEIVSRDDRIATLKKAIEKLELPAVAVDIPEEHIGQRTIDPAAETEIMVFCTETGFPVIDKDEGDDHDIDIEIVGEAFSEHAGRRGNLISVKSRLEVKAIEKDTGRIVAVDRQMGVAVGITEHVAAKTALQNAAADLAMRLIPKLAAAAEPKK